MKLNVRMRRRNKRAHAVRRLHGVVNAQDTIIRALRAQVAGLGGKALVLEDSIEHHVGQTKAISLELNMRLADCAARVKRLERVPRLVRALFGAS
jgi:hypothetical protein